MRHILNRHLVGVDPILQNKCLEVRKLGSFAYSKPQIVVIGVNECLTIPAGPSETPILS